MEPRWSRTPKDRAGERVGLDEGLLHGKAAGAPRGVHQSSTEPRQKMITNRRPAQLRRVAGRQRPAGWCEATTGRAGRPDLAAHLRPDAATPARSPNRYKWSRANQRLDRSAEGVEDPRHRATSTIDFPPPPVTRARTRRRGSTKLLACSRRRPRGGSAPGTQRSRSPDIRPPDTPGRSSSSPGSARPQDDPARPRSPAGRRIRAAQIAAWHQEHVSTATNDNNMIKRVALGFRSSPTRIRPALRRPNQRDRLALRQHRSDPSASKEALAAGSRAETPDGSCDVARRPRLVISGGPTQPTRAPAAHTGTPVRGRCSPQATRRSSRTGHALRAAKTVA